MYSDILKRKRRLQVYCTHTHHRFLSACHHHPYMITHMIVCVVVCDWFICVLLYQAGHVCMCVRANCSFDLRVYTVQVCVRARFSAARRTSFKPAAEAARSHQVQPARAKPRHRHRASSTRVRIADIKSDFARRERTRVFSQVESVAGQRRASSHSALRIPLTRSIF